MLHVATQGFVVGVTIASHGFFLKKLVTCKLFSNSPFWPKEWFGHHDSPIEIKENSIAWSKSNVDYQGRW